MNDPLNPSLSVVVVTVYNSTNLTHCLTALEKQEGLLEGIEIIAVYHEGIKDISNLRDRFSKVQFCLLSGRQTQDTLRSFGVKQTRGRIIAITVDHCTPQAHWCKRILEAHRTPHAAIGGAIEKGNQPDTLVNWAIHLYDYCNYAYYQNPIRAGRAEDLSDCNVSYKRRALEATAAFWTEEFNVPFMNRALITRGETLWLSPDIVVHQNRSIKLGRAAHIAYRRGRAFASARLNNSSLNQRILYTIFSPFLPLLLLRRLMINLSRKKSHLGIALKSLPIICLLTILWSSGEFFGYLMGHRGITIAVVNE